ncbi:hypothetical protein B0H10DRAFT_1940357 [Mycena sp. CBHHK59/15]|nr:hypothetical protein B0H10DRAFT_1940357 [Mycena sp. CBHHK59/15]
MDPCRDPFSVLVAKLASITAPPKAHQAFQQYIHESYDTEITLTVVVYWAHERVDKDRTSATNHEEEQAGFCEHVTAEACEAKATYEEAMKSLPSKDPAAHQAVSVPILCKKNPTKTKRAPALWPAYHEALPGDGNGELSSGDYQGSACKQMDIDWDMGPGPSSMLSSTLSSGAGSSSEGPSTAVTTPTSSCTPTAATATPIVLSTPAATAATPVVLSTLAAAIILSTPVTAVIILSTSGTIAPAIVLNTPAATATVVHIATYAAPKCPNDAKEWFVHAYEQVIKMRLGPVFDQLLKAFIKLEHVITTVGQLSELTAWVNSGCRCYKGKDWGGLCYLGAHGALGLVLPHVEQKMKEGIWIECVSDVRWMLNSLVVAVGNEEGKITEGTEAELDQLQSSGSG